MTKLKNNEFVTEPEIKIEKIRPLKSLKEYFSQLYLIFCVVSMTWFLADNDHFLIKCWYTFEITSLMLFRSISFVRKNLQCFLLEMCYFMTALSLYIILTDQDIKIIYPFIHGPLALYTLVYGDALNFSDLAKSTTFALHSGGGIVTRRLYWNGNQSLILSLSDLTYESFKNRFVNCLKLYFMWAIPYYIWLFFTNWKLINMAKYTFGIAPENDVHFLLKIKYCALHFFAISLALCIGILSMHVKYLNYFIVTCQIVSGFAQGASYDFTGHRINFFKLFAKAYLYTKTEIVKQVKKISHKND